MIVASGALRPYPGEKRSGDAFVIEHGPTGALLALVDALGHGPIAADVAAVAVDAIRANATKSPLQVLEACHASLVRGRGAAVSVIRIGNDGQGTFAGVGNVRARIYPESSRSPALLGTAGIVGHQRRPMREYSFTLPSDGFGILHSDGISSRLDPIPVHAESTDQLAAALLATFARDVDDACVLVFSHRSNPRLGAIPTSGQRR